MKRPEVKRALLAGALVAVALVVVVLVATLDRDPAGTDTVASDRGEKGHVRPAVASSAATSLRAHSAKKARPAASHQGFLYGRVETLDGATYRGRLRWGGDEEAFWSDYFHGSKADNQWKGHLSADQVVERRALEIFGLELASWERPKDLSRPFMARFGDLQRLEVDGREIRAVLKSGTVVELDRFAADDVADGVRVWDEARGVVDLEEWRIRSVQFLPTPPLGDVPRRLYGTVRTAQGDFEGFVRWNRQHGLGTDRLQGHDAGGELVRLPFDAIRAIVRHSPESVRLFMRDDRDLVLAGTADAGEGHRGLFVEDPRYGRVLISWDVFERLDLGAATESGPAYEHFPPGRPLEGRVTTRDGRPLAGRLVFDLDESETTETLDAPSGGVDHALPFHLVASVVLPAGDEPGARTARVVLRSGEELELELAGDLGDGNAGLLVLSEEGGSAEYVPWTEVGRIDFGGAHSGIVDGMRADPGG